MATRSTRVVSGAGFVADEHSVDLLPTGRQIDWDAVDESYADADTGKKVVPAGTVMYEVTPGGKMAPADAVGAAPADERVLGLLRTNAIEGDKSAATSGYGVIIGGAIYEDLLPVPGQVAGLADVGKGFAFYPYSDDRVS